MLSALKINATFDGELLIYDPDQEEYAVRPFSDLQKRLNRRTVSKKLIETHPAFIRVYDLLMLNGEDLRLLGFIERRRRLEDVIASEALERIDLSPVVEFQTTEELKMLRASPPSDAIEGLMLKRKTAPYVPGRPKGEWWKWKREPYLIEEVMMYAQAGPGKRRDEEIVPVGKAYFGFTDDELKLLDKFVRDNTTDRFGPVRQVMFGKDAGLVLEIAFEGLNRSPRHRSGVAMRFPRIHRIRWDKPAAEADTLQNLEALLPE